MHQRGGGCEADLQALLAGCQAEAERDMGLAGAARPERDHVLAPLDELAPGEFRRQGLVERRDRLEVEAVEALGGGELRRLDAPLDHAALAVDQLQLAEPEQILHMVAALGRALAGELGVFGVEGRQAELLEVVLQQHLGCVAHATAPECALDIRLM